MKESILSQLSSGNPWKNNLHYYDTIGSTNDQAKAMAASGAPHGTVIIAGRQTAGRGRLGRRFESAENLGVYLSVILRPDCLPSQLMHLTCAAAVTVCSAVEKAASLRPGIKWTNDLVWKKHKLGGILTELSVDSKTGRVQYAIVGIGINCCHSAADFPEALQNMAASLAMVTGHNISVSKVAAAMMDALAGMDARLLTEKAAILEEYRKNCITLGQDVVVVRGDEKCYGKAVSIDDEGALVVDFHDGTTQAVSSGEVSVRGMYGYL